MSVKRNKHLIKWLEREREVSKQAKFEQEYTVKYEEFELTPWYLMPDKLVVPHNLEDKARALFAGGKRADWNFAYGTVDSEPIDPLQNAINDAIRELR